MGRMAVLIICLCFLIHISLPNLNFLQTMLGYFHISVTHLKSSPIILQLKKLRNTAKVGHNMQIHLVLTVYILDLQKI